MMQLNILTMYPFLCSSQEDCRGKSLYAHILRGPFVMRCTLPARSAFLWQATLQKYMCLKFLIPLPFVLFFDTCFSKIDCLLNASSELWSIDHISASTVGPVDWNIHCVKVEAICPVLYGLGKFTPAPQAKLDTWDSITFAKNQLVFIFNAFSLVKVELTVLKYNKQQSILLCCCPGMFFNIKYPNRVTA